MSPKHNKEDSRLDYITDKFETEGSLVAQGLILLTEWMNARFNEISLKEDNIMAAIDDMNAKIDTITTDVQAVADFVASVKAGGATADQVTAVNARLDTVDASVKAILA